MSDESKTVVFNPPIGGIDTGISELSTDDFNAFPGEDSGAAADSDVAAPVDVAGPSIDPNKVIELGDRVLIVQEGNRISVGKVYYRTGDLLRLKSESINTQLIDFRRDYTEEEDQFHPDEKVEKSYILQKHIPGQIKFREQQGFQAGFILQGWKNESLGAKYKITNIYEDRDAIEIENMDDPSDKREVDFNYCGIPENEAFDILNITGFVALEPVIEEEQEVEVEDTEGEEDEENLDNSDTKSIGIIYAPRYREVEQLSAADEIITEEDQKNSALSSFINTLPPKDQNDPLIIRDFRILVEVLNQMKKDITDYAVDGKIVGIIDPSVSTFADLMQKVQIPNGRPVFKMNKRLYVRPKNKTDLFDKKDYKDIMSRADDILNIDNYNNRVKFPATSSSIDGTQQKSTIRFYETLKVINDEYERPWKPVISKTEPIAIKLTEDMQAFRQIVPDGYNEVMGYKPIKGPMTDNERALALVFKNAPPYPSLEEIYGGMEQVLTTTYRKGERGGKVSLLPSEGNTELVSYLLFPNSVSHIVGSRRSGSLALDMARSLEQRDHILNIIEEFGIPDPDGPDGMNSKTIITINVTAGVLTNYELTTYLEGMTIKGVNFADITIYLEDIGVSRLDYNRDIIILLEQFVTQNQARLKLALKQQRDMIKPITPAILNPILTIDKEELVKGEAFLEETLQNFLRQNEVLKNSDVAFFAYMLHYYNDFFQAKLGSRDNQETVIITKERLQVIKHRALENREIAKIRQEVDRYRAYVPVPNTCKHEGILKGIRREQDEVLFYKKLGIFLTHYQGSHSDTWTNCKVCNRHLLCVHEQLLIKAFLYPRDKDTIEKDLKLHFSGGVYQGHYICRICGQPIEDLGYENTMQFDDEGRPMNGNAPLIDEDELDLAELEMALNLPLKTDEENVRTAQQAEYYSILNALALNAGLKISNQTYNQLIVHLNTFDRIYIGSRANMEKELLERKTSYETYRYRFLVAAAAGLILIEAQTALINYIPFKTILGCVNPDFGGYPLIEDKSMRAGCAYMACNIYSFMKNQKDSEPWKHLSYITPTGKTTEGDIQTAITSMIVDMIDLIIEKNQILELDLTKKRQQQATLETEGDIFIDGIPGTFLPNKTVYKGDIDRAVAITSRNVQNQALYWLKSADALARATASTLPGFMAVNILCCPSPINEPGAFWTLKADSLIPFSETRRLIPRSAAKPMQPHFSPRATMDIITEIPTDKLYAIFLKVCHEGEHIGKSHELDINHVCIWCGFNFGKPRSLMEKRDAMGAVSKNKINPTMENFQALLDIVHVNNYVAMPLLTMGLAQDVMKTALTDFQEMDPAPIPQWNTLFETVIANLNALSAEERQSKIQIGLAMAPLSTVTEPMKVAVRAKYDLKSAEHQQILAALDTIVERSNWTNFIQILETYFIKPCQNICFNFTLSNPLSYKNDALAPEHMEKLKDMLKADRSINTTYSGLAENKTENTLTKIHLNLFINKLSQIIAFRNRINPSYFVGRDTTFKWFKEALLYGPLYTLFYPPFQDSDPRAIPAMIGDTIRNYVKQRVTYDDERVKLIIADSAEKEKQAMITSIKNLSKSEKDLMNVNKALKLGRFAIGADWRKFAQYSAEGFDTRSKEINDMAQWGTLSGNTRDTSSSRGYGDDMAGINQHAADD